MPKGPQLRAFFIDISMCWRSIGGILQRPIRFVTEGHKACVVASAPIDYLKFSKTVAITL